MEDSSSAYIALLVIGLIISVVVGAIAPNPSRSGNTVNEFANKTVMPVFAWIEMTNSSEQPEKVSTTISNALYFLEMNMG